MLTWKKTIISSMIIGASLYGGLSYARIIPGVDEPFDPPNYYSLTSVSWPDSAPSIFTLRQMGIYINQTVFIDDFFHDYIIKDFQQNAQGYYEFLNSLDSDDSSYDYSDSKRIVVDDKGTEVNYDLYKRYLLGNSSEYQFMGRHLKWETNDAYGMMNYIIDQFDKNPEKYTRYLAQSGPSNVYDPWRDKQQQENNKQIEAWFKAQIQQTISKILAMTPWGSQITGPIQDGIRVLNEKNRASDLPNLILHAKDDPKLFANTDKPLSLNDNGTSPYVSGSDKIRYMRDRLEQSAAFVQDQAEASKQAEELVREALELSTNAQGVVEVEQAKNLLNALNTEAWNRRNSLFAEMLALKSLQSMQQVDESIKAQQINNANKLYMYDPMNPTKIDEESYKRPEPIGMLNFK